MKAVYSEVEGSKVSIPIKAPEFIDPIEVFKAMGISDEKHLALGTHAIEMTTQIIQNAFPEISQYFAPNKSIIQIIKGMLSSRKAIFSLKWKLKHAVEFNAGVDQGGTEFVISINYGAIVRAASWCCEIAAIEIDNLPSGNRPTIRESWLEGGLFKVTPISDCGQERYMQLLKIVMLYLFCHEFAHAIGGHCGYLNRNRGMSDAYRKALEADADHVGGSAAGASIIHHMKVAQQLGWCPSRTPKVNSKQLIQTCVLGSLILAILFSELTDSKSKRYLCPALRSMIFVGGLQSYISAVKRLPYPGSINVQGEFLSAQTIEAEQQYGISLLKRSSVGDAVPAVYLQESDAEDLHSTCNLRDALKEELKEYLPFGMKEYLEQVRLSTFQPA